MSLMYSKRVTNCVSTINVGLRNYKNHFLNKLIIVMPSQIVNGANCFEVGKSSAESNLSLKWHSCIKNASFENIIFDTDIMMTSSKSL